MINLSLNELEIIANIDALKTMKKNLEMNWEKYLLKQNQN